MIDNPNHNDALLELLYRSLDGALTDAERHTLTTALREHAWLREEQAALLSMRSALADLRPPENPAFAEGVMQHIRHERHPLRALVGQWRAVAAAACLAIALAGGVIYGSAGNWEAEAILGLNEMELDDVYAFDE